MGEADYRKGARDRIGEAFLLLRRLLTSVRNLGVLRAGGKEDPLVADVQHVARLSYNNMRFASSRAVETRWFQLGEVTGRFTFKQAAYDYYDACSAVIKRCEAICQSPKSKTP
jgi:hypothetical protein